MFSYVAEKMFLATSQSEFVMFSYVAEMCVFSYITERV